MLVGESELALREHHAGRLDAADRGPPELRRLAAAAVDDARPLPREGDALSLPDVGRPADHAQRLHVAVVDRRQAEAIGARVRLDGEDAADAHELRIPVAPDARQPLDLGGGHREAPREGLHVLGHVDVLAEPLQ